jgi:hypothetical protein
LLKNGHLLRFPHPSSLQRTAEYASLLRISGALHLALFEQPGKDDFFSSLLLFTHIGGFSLLNKTEGISHGLIDQFTQIEGGHRFRLPLFFDSIKEHR